MIRYLKEIYTDLCCGPLRKLCLKTPWLDWPGHLFLALAAILFVVALFSGCTNEAKSRQALEDAGYTNVEVGGFAPLSCSDDDQFKTRFTATNPAGNTVSGVVCCGTFKGCTIRH